MPRVLVERATPEKLKQLGIETWGAWSCEVSQFDWHYDERETCYIMEGQVEVVTHDGSVRFGAGDIVIFPEGLSCRWKITKPVKKVYRFGY